eukprot:445269_1
MDTNIDYLRHFSLHIKRNHGYSSVHRNYGTILSRNNAYGNHFKQYIYIEVNKNNYLYHITYAKILCKINKLIHCHAYFRQAIWLSSVNNITMWYSVYQWTRKYNLSNKYSQLLYTMEKSMQCEQGDKEKSRKPIKLGTIVFDENDVVFILVNLISG